MNSLKTNKFSVVIVSLCISFAAFGQQTKTVKEGFDVKPNVVVAINTTHADIELQTWDKNRVEIEAIYTIEDLSKEEAEKYFKRWKLDIKGNSEQIDINSKGGGLWRTRNEDNIFAQMPDVEFALSNVHSILEDIDMAPALAMIKEMPPIPRMPRINTNDFKFDYEAYKKDGDAYMKKWRKEWDKNFDKEWEQKMKEWSEKMEKNSEQWAKQQEEIHEKRLKANEKRFLANEKSAEVREEALLERAKARENTIKARVEAGNSSSQVREMYFYSADGDKNMKLKKRVIIKIPKGSKLKMNVRHGEVKMANTLKNIDATLSHTVLVANTIFGSETNIKCSYSPVSIENWKEGQLRVNYVDKVVLQRVESLKLSSNSSNVQIGNLAKEGVFEGTFGTLNIDKIGDAFASLDITLENTDAIFNLPKTAFDIYFNGSNSEIEYPKSFNVTVTDTFNSKIVKGYNQQKNSDKTININAKYSSLIMQ
jgi:hypothetical protein